MGVSLVAGVQLASAMSSASVTSFSGTSASALGSSQRDALAEAADCFDRPFRRRCGTANQTTADRPMLYYTYARSGFEDLVNYRHAGQQTSILHGLSAAG